jgi:hypothetical protein
MRLFLAILALFGCLCAPGAAGATSTENSRLRFSFDSSGRLTGVYNKATRREYYHGGGRRILRVLCLEGKAPVELPMAFRSLHAEAIPGGRALRLVYGGDGVTASVEIRVRDDDAKSIWNLTLSNSGDREVVEVVFPDLDRMQIGRDPADDVLMRANRDGQRIPNPIRNLFHETGEIVDGVKYFAPQMNNETMVYPGMAGMLWMDLYDPTGGLYVASEDKELIGGYLQNAAGGDVGMAIGKYLHVKRGQSFALPVAVGVHTGDWHWGADRYREWAQSFFHKAHIPRWVREMPNWYWRGMLWTMGMERPKFASPFTWSDLDGKLLDGAMRLHGGVIGIAGNEFLGHDYPFWWPDPMLGGEAVLKARVADVNRRGGHVVPYINPIYTWENFPNVPHSDDPDFQWRYRQIPPDVKQPIWAQQKDHMARTYDGGLNYVETQYFGSYPEACLADPAWQDWVLWWTHRYAAEYGFSGVQWDQLGAYPLPYCADWRHGHQHGGSSAQGLVQMARRIFEDPVYKVSPDFYIWYEGGGDCQSQYLQSAHSGWDCWHAYTFPTMIQYTFQSNFYGGEFTPPEGSTGSARVRQKRSAEFSLLGRYKMGAGGGELAEKVAQIALITNAIKGVYWYTKFKDNLGCTAPAGLVTSVLEIDPGICPYVGSGGYVIPYMDIRKDKRSCGIGLSKRLYDLRGVKAVYWYPGHLLGLREEIPFDNSGSERLVVKLPDLGHVNLFRYETAHCDVDDTVSSVGAIVIVKQRLRPLKVLAPRRVTASSELRLIVAEQHVGGEEVTVSTTLGAARDERGLAQVPVSDGASEQVVKAGRECVQTSHDRPYIYFQARDGAFEGGESIVKVKVDYFDEGKGTFRLQYNSSDPHAIPYGFESPTNREHKSSAVLFRGDTRTWKTATFVLPDALFGRRMSSGGDIRIDACGGPGCFGAVRVTKMRVSYTPVANATVCVGNDRRTTDAHGMLHYRFAKNDPGGDYIVSAYKEGKGGYLPTATTIEYGPRRDAR